MKVAWIKVVMSTQWALNPSEQPGPLLPPSSFPSDNSYIWGRNADEVSHWGGSEDEPATDTTCFHGTDAQLPFFHPTFSLLTLLSLLSPIVDLQKRRTFPHLSLVASAYLFSISLSVFLLQCPPASFYFSLSLLSPPPLTLSLSFSLFPSPSSLSDIWANNQCHFILVREQMEFQLRAWQQVVNKGFSVMLLSSLLCSRDPGLHQVWISSSHTEAHPDSLTIRRMWYLYILVMVLLVFSRITCYLQQVMHFNHSDAHLATSDY